METNEIIGQPMFEREMYSDFEEHLEGIVIDRVMTLDGELRGKFLYSFRITKTPNRTNYHTFDYTKLNEISRRLINGMVSLGKLPNRKFWSKYFEGGIRSVSIIQEDFNEFPSFNLNHLLFSSYDNLDVRIISQLSTRVRMIDPSLSISLKYLGQYDINIIKNNLDFRTNFILDSIPVEKLGQRNFDKMVLNPIQRPCFIGNLFSPSKTLIEKLL